MDVGSLVINMDRLMSSAGGFAPPTHNIHIYLYLFIFRGSLDAVEDAKNLSSSIFFFNQHK